MEPTTDTSVERERPNETPALHLVRDENRPTVGPAGEDRRQYVVFDVRGEQLGFQTQVRYADPRRSKDVRWAGRISGNRELMALSGAELIADFDTSRDLVICEGPYAADELRTVGLQAVGTWGTSNLPSVAALEACVGFSRVLLWADRDDPGAKHMAALASRLLELRIEAGWVIDPEAADDSGDDAADYLMRHAGPLSHGDFDGLVSSERPPWAKQTASEAVPDDAADWPPLAIPEESDQAQALNLEACLPSELVPFIRDVSACVSIEASAIAALACAAISAAAGNAYSVRVDGVHVEPCVSRFVVVAMAPGERKTSASKSVFRPFERHAQERASEYPTELRRYQAELKERQKLLEVAVRQAAKSTGAPKDKALREARLQEEALSSLEAPVPAQLVVGNITQEALVREACDRRGAVGLVSSDARGALRIILGKYDKDGHAEDDAYLKLHGGDLLDRVRAGKDGDRITISHPALAMALMVQPDLVEQLARNSDLANSGFLQRLHLHLPRSRVGTRVIGPEPRLEDEAVRGAWDRAICRIIEQRFSIMRGAGAKPQELALASEVRDAWRQEHNRIEAAMAPGEQWRDRAGFASKLPGEIVRLSALFQLFMDAAEGRDSTVVGLRAWRAAVAFSAWSFDETQRCLGRVVQSPEERDAHALLRWAKTTERPGFHLREAQKSGPKPIRTKDRLTVALEILELWGAVRRTSDELVQLHPALLGEESR